METTGADTTPTLTTETESPWLGLDLATLEIHSRARMLQSKQRAERLRRKNLSLSYLLEVAQAQRHIEVDIRRRTARMTEIIHPQAVSEEIHLQAEDIDLRMRNASTDRERLVVLRETQPPSAIESRRWS